jgi:3-deoxy-D-manno-oct-2-ulosonic acid (Kdo) hydroxylase
MSHIFTCAWDQWRPSISAEEAAAAVAALESGAVVYLPQLNFHLEAAEQSLLSMPLHPQGAKNISYNPSNHQLGGLEPDTMVAVLIKAMLQRYHHFSTQLLESLCPQYQPAQCSGRTSFRPVEIKGRQPVSYRKDDTRLHVDAFPSTPVNKTRILRVFTNINPDGESRKWRIGESFADVIDRFLPRVRRMLPFEAEILYRLKATREKRTHYDHCMLQIHHAMKADLGYQRECPAIEMDFPPGSTWIVYTDLVSHAALAGRLALEQTYYPSVDSMLDPLLSPQRRIQNKLERRL